ncbi:unnamed protein product [Gongylonema pulchrum]|uniref:Rx_N domain-containing protein n=1 Tax=Gongylonema pulchrum TaxID=637853 RepID=A0A183D8R3_9BILA|nr:unnamed protein product [Gongylonema pulchrum]
MGAEKFVYSWKRIGDLLAGWSHGLEVEMPGVLSELAQWLYTAEQIIDSSVDLRVDDAQQSLANITESISHHKVRSSLAVCIRREKSVISVNSERNFSNSQ